MLLKLYYKVFNTVFNGDCTVYDRYKWLSRYLPPTNDKHNLLDIGCGNGTSLFLASEKGYKSMGITWSQVDKNKIYEKIKLINPINNIDVLVQDVRELNYQKLPTFNIITCTETIEHIIDEKKLIKNISNLLVDKGLLFLTTPNLFFKFKDKDEDGPFTKDFEDGNHVVRGYTFAYLEKILKKNKMVIVKRHYITGPLSKFLLKISRKINLKFFKPLWIILTIIFHFFDIIISNNDDANYSIGIIAQKFED